MNSSCSSDSIFYEDSFRSIMERYTEHVERFSQEIMRKVGSKFVTILNMFEGTNLVYDWSAFLVEKIDIVIPKQAPNRPFLIILLENNHTVCISTYIHVLFAHNNTSFYYVEEIFTYTNGSCTISNEDICNVVISDERSEKIWTCARSISTWNLHRFASNQKLFGVNMYYLDDFACSVDVEDNVSNGKVNFIFNFRIRKSVDEPERNARNHIFTVIHGGEEISLPIAIVNILEHKYKNNETIERQFFMDNCAGKLAIVNDAINMYHGTMITSLRELFPSSK